MTDIPMIETPSPNYDERSLPITMLVLHYTGMPDAASAINWLANTESKVSAHYVVTEDGQIIRMVAEDKRAWHAGRSHWRGIDDVNSASIGIEIVNPGHEWGYRPFPEAQMGSLIPLVHDIVQRQLTRPGEAAVALTDAEFRTLSAFLDRPQRVLTRDQLIEHARGLGSDVFDRAIDVTISRLRKKLAPDDPIRTVRNEGYMFTLKVEG